MYKIKTKIYYTKEESLHFKVEIFEKKIAVKHVDEIRPKIEFFPPKSRMLSISIMQ